jgi:hypothetical protein
MAGVKHLGMTAGITPMMDDQKALVHVAPDKPLPAGGVLSWVSSDPSSATVDPTVGIDGTPSTDPLAAVVFGVHGVAGDPSITASFTNADGTVASGVAPFHIVIDPAELDVSDLAVTVDTPVKQ